MLAAAAIGEGEEQLDTGGTVTFDAGIVNGVETAAQLICVDEGRSGRVWNLVGNKVPSGERCTREVEDDGY